jgi:hypothetical protein
MWKAYSQLRADSKKKKTLAFLIWRCSNQALSRFWFCTGTSIARPVIGGYLELFIYLGALVEFSFVFLQSAFLFICVFQFVVSSLSIRGISRSPLCCLAACLSASSKISRHTASMQSIDETGKPRYRAACDACRQSKVRCSGGGVCIRCKKHDYKCRYSIAHRAGKPKGSKNKATLKKLENLQAAQRGKLALGGGTGAASTRKMSRPLTDAEFPQQRKRRRGIVRVCTYLKLLEYLLIVH